jgi:aldose 1-epimerase
VTIWVSGTQYTLRAGEYEAEIASVGASLRSLAFSGRDLVVPFGADEVRPAYRGATLAPWPNRIVDGRYTFDGVDYELALTEPRRGQALHGLLVWTDYEVVEHASSSVTLRATIQPQAGYPSRVVVDTRYSLSDNGLDQSVTAYNDGSRDAPWGCGPHPYLTAGSTPLNEWLLKLPASKVLRTTEDRLSPTELIPVDRGDAARFDFRQPRALGRAEIDHAYTELGRDAKGVAQVTLVTGDGAGVSMTWGEDCAWVQVHTADLPGGAAEPGHRVGLAVEPMTCAPDAFNPDRYAHDTGLITLRPGEESRAQWRIAAL